jgi:hypothetical protein
MTSFLKEISDSYVDPLIGRIPYFKDVKSFINDKNVIAAKKHLNIVDCNVDSLLSIIIVYKNEPYLNKTIDDLYTSCVGPIEILVEDDKGDGRRIITNKLVNQANGKYICMLDAHCKLSYGWDICLKEFLKNGDLITSRICILNPDAWENDSSFYADYYSINLSNFGFGKSISCCNNSLIETLDILGCFFVLTRDTFLKFDGCRTDLYSQWGNFESEWALNIWLSGGHCYCLNSTLCAHWFKTRETACCYNKRHLLESIDLFKDLVLNKKLKNQIFDFSWLLDKFNYSDDDFSSGSGYAFF